MGVVEDMRQRSASNHSSAAGNPAVVLATRGPLAKAQLSPGNGNLTWEGVTSRIGPRTSSRVSPSLEAQGPVGKGTPKHKIPRG